MEPEENDHLSLEDELEDEEMIEPENKDNTEKRESLKLGSILMMVVTLACLVVVIWIIFIAWTTPKSAPVLTLDNTESDSEQLEDVYVDETVVEGRNPEVLGITVDAIIGSFFTVRETSMTLYINTNGDECSGECLNDWTPYEATVAIEDDSALGTTAREDGVLQYTWNGQGLYTYDHDEVGSVLGDGYKGTWEIARP